MALIHQGVVLGQHSPIAIEYPYGNPSQSNNLYPNNTYPNGSYPNESYQNNFYPNGSPQYQSYQGVAQPPNPSGEYLTVAQDVVAPEAEMGQADALAKRMAELEKELQEHIESEKISEQAELSKEDKSKPVIKPRGRLHSDANWFHQSGLNRSQVRDLEDGVFARRARLGFDGSFMENTEVRLDYEMGAAGHPNLFDAYGNLLNVPYLGTIRMGQFREPFSLEAQTSSNFYTFMERAYNTTFDPSRNWGLMFYNHDDCERLTWALGAFRDNTNAFGADAEDSGGRAVTGRTTWLPFFSDENDGDNYWAVGSSYSYRNPRNDRVRYGVKPLNFLSEAETNRTTRFEVPNILSAQIEDVDSVQIFGLETTRTIGPLNLQAEYIGYQADQTAEVYYSHGSYAQASFFLTGEHRRWNNKLGTFAPTKVQNPFLSSKGKGFQGTGAWEIAVRWCDISVEAPSGAISKPGYSRAYTTGLNWYLNDNMRMMVNASLNHLYRDSIESDLNVFHTRLDIHF